MSPWPAVLGLEPRSWLWKTAYVVPVCLALGQLGGLHAGVFRAGVACGCAGDGTGVVVWRAQSHVQWNAAQMAHFRFLAAAETSLDAFSLLEAVRDKTGVMVDFRFIM